MITALAFSEVGDHRVNEDAYCVQPHPLDPSVWICFVADGQGGRAGGAVAAQLACRHSVGIASAAKTDEMAKPAFWMSLLGDVDRVVADDPVAGFTTFVGLAITADRVTGVSHGDSAAVLVCGDDTTKLTFSQHKNPPIGSGAAVPVPFSTKLQPQWKLLLMTDGVWKYVGWGRVVDTARRMSGESLIHELQQPARLPGSGRFQDDFTVVLVESAIVE